MVRGSGSRALLVPVALTLAAALAGCSGGAADDGATSSEQEPTSSEASGSTEAGTPSSGPSEGSTAASGCAATDAAVPDGATSGGSADVDGDGQPDEVWLADVDGEREVGIATASGAVFSTTFELGGPQAATAYEQTLGDGSAVVLLDGGRSVPMYAVVDCALVPTQNAQGEQYTFDRGFTGYGTGVGCVEGADGLEVVGYLAETDADAGTTEVTSTPIVLADGGASASNGEPTSRQVSSDDPLVETAQSVSCGDADGVAEPAS